MVMFQCHVSFQWGRVFFVGLWIAGDLGDASELAEVTDQHLFSQNAVAFHGDESHGTSQSVKHHCSKQFQEDGGHFIPKKLTKQTLFPGSWLVTARLSCFQSTTIFFQTAMFVQRVIFQDGRNINWLVVSTNPSEKYAPQNG